MKHIINNDHSTKIFEIGETDLLSKKLIIPPVSEYVSTMEKSYGENKVTEKQLESIKKNIFPFGQNTDLNLGFWTEKTGISYTFWNRIQRTRDLYDLKKFNWFDFSSTYFSLKGFDKTKTRPDTKTKYQGKTVYYFKEEFENLNDLINTYGIREGLKLNNLLTTHQQNIYAKETYFNRLFNLLKKLIETFKWTPEHIELYNKNRNRINWFKDNVWKHFFSCGKEANEASQKLREMGYNVFPDHVYYDHAPSIKRN